MAELIKSKRFRLRELAVFAREEGTGSSGRALTIGASSISAEHRTGLLRRGSGSQRASASVDALDLI